MERLYQVHLDGGERTRAAHAAFWVGFRLVGMSEMGRASGWFSRAHRLVEKTDCVEQGYLLLPTVHRLSRPPATTTAHARRRRKRPGWATAFATRI